MTVYIYQAAFLCEECGEKVMAQGMRDTGDSDDYPQGPYSDGGGESDSPQYCDHCHVFLENPLTADGVEYVRELIHDFDENGRGTKNVIDEWREFYRWELDL